MTDTKTPPADDLVRRLRQNARMPTGVMATVDLEREAAVAIEALQAELREKRHTWACVEIAVNRAEAAERRAEAAEGDARRYRWLRDDCNETWTVFGRSWPQTDADRLDAAIDAAIAAQDAKLD